VDIAPSESMQFGWALLRILQAIACSDSRFGPVFMATIDTADAFYCITLLAANVTNLGVIFLSEAGNEPLVALPFGPPYVMEIISPGI
jgi:hypothetical protein